MDDDMKRIFDSLEKLNDKQSDMNGILSVNTENLRTHMKRTELLENRVDKTESWIDKVKGAHKLILIIGTVIGLSAGIIKIL